MLNQQRGIPSKTEKMHRGDTQFEEDQLQFVANTHDPKQKITPGKRFPEGFGALIGIVNMTGQIIIFRKSLLQSGDEGIMSCLYFGSMNLRNNGSEEAGLRMRRVMGIETVCESVAVAGLTPTFALEGTGTLLLIKDGRRRFGGGGGRSVKHL